MPIIIQETSVDLSSAPDGQPTAAPTAAEQQANTSVVPLRPSDVERIQRYLLARRARLHAD